jgi:hypothetical protein
MSPPRVSHAPAGSITTSSCDSSLRLLSRSFSNGVPLEELLLPSCVHTFCVCALLTDGEQWFTPTIGLGCRSGSYILYAATGTLIWAIMVASSWLSYYSTIAAQRASPPRLANVPPSPLPAVRVTSALAILLRRLGKFLAVCNSVWIVLSCIFQFSSFYDRCYCNSSVLGLGKNAYDVITLLDSDIGVMKGSWIGGTESPTG